MLSRRNILSALIVAILALAVNCGRGPVPRTYSISGDVTLVNDCSGNGGYRHRTEWAISHNFSFFTLHSEECAGSIY